ncbi:MAG: hypothetical protein Q9180_004621, partial [Flavoplaca navasiana]
MVLTDLTDIIDRIGYWLTKSDSDIVPKKIGIAYTQKGGWEGWAQVEIAYLVQVRYPNVTIDREVNVYTGTRKENDFVVKDNNNVTPIQIVELKCERGTQSATEFSQSFKDDIEKINNHPIGTEYKPAKAYATAISCTEASFWRMKQAQFEWKHEGLKVTRQEFESGICL